MAKRRRLGEILIGAGLITETQLGAALQSQRTWGGKHGSTLVRMGFVKEEDILRCLSEQLRLPSIDFRKVKVSSRAIEAIPQKVAEKYNVVPVALKEGQGKRGVILAMSDPVNLDAIAEIQFQAGVQVRPVVATESAIARAIDHYYRDQQARTRYGYEKKVDLSTLPEDEEMVIIGRDQGGRVDGSRLDRLDARTLVELLLEVLEEKGVIERRDLEEALRRKA